MQIEGALAMAAIWIGAGLLWFQSGDAAPVGALVETLIVAGVIAVRL